MKEIPLFLSENPLQPLKQDTVGRIAQDLTGRHTFGYLPPKAQYPNKDIPHAIPPIPDRIEWNVNYMSSIDNPL